jgi:3-oxoacyl-(acyl-carrier-protein) synthase
MDGRRDQGGPIAVIGIACRFPGARDPAEFHDLTVAGLRLFRPVFGSAPGRARHAALLDDWKATRASSGEVEPGSRDLVPIQRLAAETTALALADAGLRSAGEAIGSAGEAMGEAADRRGRAGLIIASATPHVCGLVSEQFGFSNGVRYPETAYLSSLHAVIAAASALQAGELDLAVAGGAELGVDPAWLDQQARAGTLGSDEMRVYAADPAGLLPGEGCGIVILVRAADAHAAGLPVYAEIAGWSTAPVLRPTPIGTALLPAYHRAGIDPADVHLVEGHGTGTAAGDLTELTTLAQLRQDGKTTAALGAVSANIGYSRAATGIASLIKATLAMATGTIPPGTGCARPHPLIEAGDARLRLPERPEAWPDGTRLAAVNSLGTANPATMDGASAWPGAEGVHLILRREPEADHGRGGGRRRRVATEVSEAASDRAAGARPAAPGRHAAPRPPDARDVLSREASDPEAVDRALAAIAPATAPAPPATGAAPDGDTGATPDTPVLTAPTATPTAEPTDAHIADAPVPTAPTATLTAATPAPPAATDAQIADTTPDAPVPTTLIAAPTAAAPAATDADIADTTPDAPVPTTATAAPTAATPEPPAATDAYIADTTPDAPVLTATTAARTAAAGVVLAPMGAPVMATAVTSGWPPAATDTRTAEAAPAADVAGVAAATGAGAASGVSGGRAEGAVGLAFSAGVLAPPGVFVLGGGNARALADRLDVIAASAPVLSFAELWELARQLAVGAVRGCDEGGAVLRVALAPATPQQLAGQARQAARRLRADGLSAAAAEPGVRISAGAAGNVVVVFPGLVESAAGHSALLAASLAGLRTLELAGVRPGAAVGYSLGEITGLVWAGSLAAAEAARLVAQRGQILLGCSSGPAAMARIGADARVARALCAPDRLHIAAYEGPRAQVLAGSIAGIRDMVRRAGAAGVAAEVLGVASAQHSPAMARCTAPLRSVLAGTPFAPPQRRLISTITGRQDSPDDDTADLLARQLSLPVLFAQALMAATDQSERTDLIVTAGPDDGLAIVAAGCSGVPAIALPVTRHGTLDANSVISAQAVAALFAAGAVTDLSPFLAVPGSTLAAGTMPRMLDAEPHPGPGPEPPAVPLLSLVDSGRTVDHGSGRGTTARSG